MYLPETERFFRSMKVVGPIVLFPPGGPGGPSDGGGGGVGGSPNNGQCYVSLHTIKIHDMIYINVLLAISFITITCGYFRFMRHETSKTVPSW